LDKTPHILLVSADPTLKDEFEAARSRIPNHPMVVWFTSGFRQGVEFARTRQPDLLCVEMDRDFRRFRDFTRDVAAISPTTAVVAIYRTEVFTNEESETAIVVESLRAGVRDFLHRPVSSHDLEAVLGRLLQGVEGGAPTTLGSIVSFVSNKGGVGKSTLAVNAAVRLAERNPGRVLLVDSSLQLGVCSYMLDLQPKSNILDAVRQRERLDETLLRQLSAPHSSGLRLLGAPSNALLAAEVSEDSMANVLQVARRAFDLVIVDTFPLLDSLVLAILDLSDLVHVVLQSTVPNVAGARPYFKVLDEIGVPRSRIRVILNQNYVDFPGNLTLSDVEAQIGCSVDNLFPYQKKVLTALNAGDPLALHAGRRFGYGKALEGLVEEILAGVAPNRNGTYQGNGSVEVFQDEDLLEDPEEEEFSK